MARNILWTAQRHGQDWDDPYVLAALWSDEGGFGVVSDVQWKGLRQVLREDDISYGSSRMIELFMGSHEQFSPSLHGRTRDQRRLDHESPYEAVEDILGYLAFYPNDTYSITAYVATIVPPVTNADLLSAENDRPIGPQPGCRIF
ncbi:hypothetical protein ELG69_16355 [Rhizobium leguminosarum]|nr:hypothetical protein ELG69_16355 [Rhizobium leguminosarum]